MKPEIKDIKFQITLFIDYQKPNGFLSPCRAAHGLFFYAVNARRTYEEFELGTRTEFVGNLSMQPNYRQSFESIAAMYGVNPDEMAKYWDEVDMQFVALDIPQVPKEEKYRLNRTPMVN